MNERTRLITIGIVLFLAGGAVLAFAPTSWGTGIGTVAGLTGVAVLIWGVLRGGTTD